MNTLQERSKLKRKIGCFLTMLFSLLLSALVYNIFLLPINLVTGGTSGIATIISYLYKIDPSAILMLLSLGFIIISFLYLDKEESIASIAASIIYPVLVKLTSNITTIITIDYSDMLVITIFAGIISGLSNGLMYKSGYNNCGLPTISRILYKYHKIPIATSTTVMNIIIVIISGLFFGWTNVMYAIILLYINGIMINKVLLGISNNKAFYIISSECDEIKKFIIKELGHSVTIFDVKGAFLQKKRKVLLTVIPSSEYFRVTEGIKEIDKKSFFIATDSYEVQGAK